VTLTLCVREEWESDFFYDQDNEMDRMGLI
jgi:hypothetical protein